jgi:hypothetical protein
LENDALLGFRSERYVSDAVEADRRAHRAYLAFMNQEITLSFNAIRQTTSERIVEVILNSVVFTTPLKMSKPAARVSKVALSTLKQLSRKQPKRCPRKRTRQKATLEVQEEEESTARQQRANETKQRNADPQKLDIFTKRKKRLCSGTVPISSASDADAEGKQV